VLAAPEKAGLDAVRDGQLFCFNMFATLDGSFLQKARDLLSRVARRRSKKPACARISGSAARSAACSTAAISSPLLLPQAAQPPESIEELFKLNDVELFDLQADPNEVDNLALEPKKHADLIVA